MFQREQLRTAILGCVADILNLSNEHIERNLTGIKEKLPSIDCIERDVDRLILDYLQVLFLSSRNFNDNIVCLIQPEIYIQHVTINAYILCTSTLSSWIKELEKLDYS